MQAAALYSQLMLHMLAQMESEVAFDSSAIKSSAS